MFGYVVANIDDLDDEEKARYRAVYCGLCRVLKERGGQRSRVCLTYDLTFLVIRLDWGIGLHVPYDTGKKGYYNIPDFKDGMGVHLAIGYPF